MEFKQNKVFWISTRKLDFFFFREWNLPGSVPVQQRCTANVLSSLVTWLSRRSAINNKNVNSLRLLLTHFLIYIYPISLLQHMTFFSLSLSLSLTHLDDIEITLPCMVCEWRKRKVLLAGSATASIISLMSRAAGETTGRCY